MARDGLGMYVCELYGGSCEWYVQPLRTQFCTILQVSSRLSRASVAHWLFRVFAAAHWLLEYWHGTFSVSVATSIVLTPYLIVSA
jgi:hypothetical protein